MHACMHLLIYYSLPMTQVQEFIDLVSGSDSLYGLCPDTLNSLVISLLPAVDHTYPEIGELSLVDNSRNIRFYILQEIVQALRECTGLFVPKVGGRGSPCVGLLLIRWLILSSKYKP